MSQLPYLDWYEGAQRRPPPRTPHRPGRARQAPEEEAVYAPVRTSRAKGRAPYVPLPAPTKKRYTQAEKDVVLAHYRRGRFTAAAEEPPARAPASRPRQRAAPVQPPPEEEYEDGEIEEEEEENLGLSQ